MTTAHAPNAFISETLAQYTPRAATYDNSNGGWHAELGHDYVAWLPPPKDGAVLDLACGTGLVSLPYAEAVGPGGIVVGVDVTEAMLNEAKAKPLLKDSGEVKWILGDITDLDSIDSVQEVVKKRGGFDVISCCSAFVLLESPEEAVKSWAPLLKPGSGRLVMDVPTEDHSLQYLLNYPLRRALGKPMTFDQNWVNSVHSLDKIFQDAGLQIQESFRTRSYIPEKWYAADQAMEVLEEKTKGSESWQTLIKGWTSDQGEGAIEKLTQAWSTIWKENLNAEGKLWDGHKLYVTIGRRGE